MNYALAADKTRSYISGTAPPTPMTLVPQKMEVTKCLVLKKKGITFVRMFVSTFFTLVWSPGNVLRWPRKHSTLKEVWETLFYASNLLVPLHITSWNMELVQVDLKQRL